MKKIRFIISLVISIFLLGSCNIIFFPTKEPTKTETVDLFKATFYFNDDKSNVKIVEIEKGKELSELNYDTSIKDGYSPKGWFLDSNFNTKAIFPITMSKDINLYLKWEKDVIENTPTEEISFFKLNVYYNDDKNSSTSFDYEEGTIINKPDSSQYKKEGYEQGNWYLDSNFNSIAAFPITIIKDTNLYLKWVEIENINFTVTFMNGANVYLNVNVQENTLVNKPTNPTKQGYNFLGWSFNEDEFVEFDFNSSITKNITLYAYFELINTETSDSINVTNFGGYNEGAYFEFESKGFSSTSFEVTYKQKNSSTTYKVDKELLRKYNNTIRCDIVGLVKGDYDVTIINNANNASITKIVSVSSHDRSGYAHFDNTSGVGAYNDDGSLKENTIIIYVNDSNKNSVTAKIANKTYTGLVNILVAAKNSNYPICIRILGAVKTAQWNYMSHGKGNTSERLANLNSIFNNASNFTNGKLYYDSIISAGINSMSDDINNGITILNGLTTAISYSGGEYDSYYNMLDISEGKNITIEGIGTDAVIYQWGFNFKKCSNIEVRNITFDRYTEDAIGFEGDKNNISTYGNYWIHNCTFKIGVNNWDVCYEADKGDGDGSTDFKYCRGVTISYCEYIQTHKTILIGGSDTATQYNFTLHHNYFNNCNSRLPLVRQTNIHIYNNYFYKTSGTCSSIRANCSMFAENNYYDNAKNPFNLVKTSTYTGTSLKSIGNYFLNCSTSNNSSNGLSTYLKTNNVSSRTESITGSCNPTGSKELINFDTNSSLFYYDSTNKVSNVESLLAAENVKDHCLNLSGVLKGDTLTDYVPDDSTGNDNSNDNNNSESTPSASIEYISFDSFTVGTITSNTTLNGVTLNIKSGKTLEVKETDKTIGEKQINSYIYLSGGGSFNELSINFNTSKAASITVYFSSTGTSLRYPALYSSLGLIEKATVGSSSSSSIESFTFSNVEAGNYSICSSSSGLNVYLIIINY